MRNSCAMAMERLEERAFAVRVEGIGPHLRVITPTRRGVAQRGQTIVIQPIILQRKPEDRAAQYPFWIR
jgi:hypothetical protein